MSKPRELEVKAVLDEELERMFKAIKDEYRLKNVSETIRFCITREYKRLFPNPGQPTPPSTRPASATPPSPPPPDAQAPP